MTGQASRSRRPWCSSMESFSRSRPRRVLQDGVDGLGPVVGQGTALLVRLSWLLALCILLTTSLSAEDLAELAVEVVDPCESFNRLSRSATVSA